MPKKKWSALLMIVMLLFAAGNVLANPETASWQQAFKIDVTETYNMVGFQNENFGITVGYGGEVHYTNDGGKSWPRAANDSLCRFGLDIVDEQIAWNCGNGGHIRLSTDGGKNWRGVQSFGSTEPSHCRYMSFLDAQTGWVASPYLLGVTSDGGQKWSEIKLPKEAGEIAAICLRTVACGYLLDDKGMVYITEDGGRSWKIQSLGLKNVKLTIMRAPFAAIRFTSADEGIVVFSDQVKGIWALFTQDGGKTWRKEKVSDDTGTIYLSRDGKFLTIAGFVDISVTLYKYRENR